MGQRIVIIVRRYNIWRIEPGTFTLEDSLVHLSARFYRAMIKHVSRELLDRGLEITAEQWHVLILLRHRNGQTQKELAWRLYKDKTTIAKSVATLESGGMVDRKRGLKDRREKKVSITEKGMDVLDGVTVTVREVNAYRSGNRRQGTCHLQRRPSPCPYEVESHQWHHGVT